MDKFKFPILCVVGSTLTRRGAGINGGVTTKPYRKGKRRKGKWTRMDKKGHLGC